MLLITKLGKKIYLPTAGESDAINVGIATDPDTYELSDKEFLTLKPLGRPKSETPKKSTTIRFSDDVLTPFRNTGKGWQTRMDNALRDWLKTHPLA